MKFEAVQIHFLSDVFGLLSSKNFATMAMWRNDFSSLLSPHVLKESKTVLDSGFHAVDSGFQVLNIRFFVSGT